MELGKWIGVTRKQKSWKTVEKQGKFSVTGTGLEGHGRVGGGGLRRDGEVKDCDYKIYMSRFS